MTEADVRRAADGSPRLVKRGLEHLGEAGRLDYTRASYMSGFIESSEHITRWRMRYLAKAMGQNEDLAALAACETYSTGLKNAPVGREKTASGRRLDGIIERALDRAGIAEKADRGTAFHGFTEPAWWTAGGSYDNMPERFREAVKQWWATVAANGIEIVATEQFTANDETMSAGTFDHLVRVIGHPVLTDYVIADKKTGNWEPYEWIIQLSTYANGEPYDTSNDTRPAWPGPINKDWGLVLHTNVETAKTDLVVVDLQQGWRLAKLAAAVRDAQDHTNLAAPMRSTTFTQRLDAAKTNEDLRIVWASTDKAEEQELVRQKASAL